MGRNEIIERERRWALPAAIAALVSVLLVVVSLVLLANEFGGDGDAELLRKVDKDSGTLLLIYVIRAIGLALLTLPLAYLFRAALARSEAMRGQLIGLVIAGPLFLAAFSVLDALSLQDAATAFADRGNAGSGERADEAAQTLIDDASLRDLAAGFGFAGTLGFAFAMAYTCLHAMRVGLLSRLWGSLGIALGVASFFLLQYALLWFAYLGLLIAGWLPRGRPPAWAAGTAIPWPTPGQQAAESLGGEDEPDRLPPEAQEGGPGDPPFPAGESEQGAPSEGSGLKRKRKRRR